MHPDNPYYNNPPNFQKLGEKYPSFKAHLIASTSSNNAFTIDYKDPNALRELTTCLLKEDFGLDVSLPEDRLCPTLANRLDYISHLLSLSNHLNLPLSSSIGPNGENLKILDIGTGAIAIYPILIGALKPRARVWATEIDPPSQAHATQTLLNNSSTLGDRITLIHTTSSKPILSFISTNQEFNVDSPLTFTMCNPPFYSSQEEIGLLKDGKTLGAHAAPTAAENELITPGGEINFVGRMIEESLGLKRKCLWYTSLLGKASSISPLCSLLKKHEIDNYFLLAIRQAHTTRWILGWSFTTNRLPDALTRSPSSSITKYLPPPNTFFQPLQLPRQVDKTLLPVVIHKVLAEGGFVEPQTMTQNLDGSFILKPREVSWSRGARRKVLKSSSGGGSAVMIGTNDIEQSVMFTAKLFITEKDGECLMQMDWVNGEGKVRINVESLWNFLSRKVGDAVKDIKHDDEE